MGARPAVLLLLSAACLLAGGQASGARNLSFCFNLPAACRGTSALQELSRSLGALESILFQSTRHYQRGLEATRVGVELAAERMHALQG